MAESKTVFVSGSNRGIGKAITKLFAERGWNIIAHAREKSDEFEHFITFLGKENKITITPIYFDLCDEDTMVEQIKAVISKPKLSIDALINCAGICEIKMFMMAPLASIRKVFDVNLFSHMRLTQLILKRMPEGSSIVNIASMDGLVPQRGETAYASSKAAMLAWTEVLRLELLGRIRVNAIAPSAVNTDMAHQLEDQAVWKGSEIIEPEDVASAVYFLASSDAKGVTGEVMKITGKLN